MFWGMEHGPWISKKGVFFKLLPSMDFGKQWKRSKGEKSERSREQGGKMCKKQGARTPLTEAL